MLETPLSANAEMLIRRPVEEVFEAFINPAITTQFWFTKSSGRLQVGKQIRWDWEMYNVSTQVYVGAIEKNKRIQVEWQSQDALTALEWNFTPHPNDTTFVNIINSGFVGTEEEIMRKALSSTAGFTLVLAGLKALLEHNIRLNLVLDHFAGESREP